MTKANPYWGTSLDTFLGEAGIRETVKADAATRVITWRRNDIREKIAAGMISLRAGEGTDRDAFLASMDDELAKLEPRKPV